MYSKIPVELYKYKNWVCWTAEPDTSRPGKYKKIPINPISGNPAKSNDPKTWTDFKTAETASKKYSGLGFMFSNSPYFGVDIDGVDDAINLYKTGDPDNIIAEFIHGLQTYSEYSVSGKGIHIICRGSLPPRGRRKNNVEMYSDGRYFAMTGNAASEYTDIAECTDTIKSLHEKFIGGGTVPTIYHSTPGVLNLSESEIITMAEKSKQGVMFKGLYNGSWESYFSSQSEADMSLCNILAFWSGKDETVMDNLFRNSGLMRVKWDRKQSGSTYGKLTIDKAIRSCMNVYEPKQEFSISIDFATKAKISKLYSFDDTGNAQRYIDLFGKNIRYSHTNKSWIYFDGRKWCFDDNGAIRRMGDEANEIMRGDIKLYSESEESEKLFLKHVKNSRSSKSKAATIKESEHVVPIKPSELDVHKDLLNVTNGTIDLRTGELELHNRDNFLTKICNVEYTDNTDHPLWDKFLLDIFDGDMELINFIQKAVGYSLTGSTKEDCCFFCFGTGRNGKSTFLDIISDMLGDYAMNIQAETVMVKKNQGGPSGDIARLKGARFVTSSEPNEGVRIDEGLLKQLTGGDKVTASKKYENEFEFMPEFKLWLATNHEPVIRGTDIGIWSRIRLIPFTVFMPEERRDLNLSSKLRKEMPGILKWAVDGYFMYKVDGLAQPKSVLEATSLYKNNMDVISSFLDACVRSGVGTERAGELFQLYAKWSKVNNEYEMKSTKFGIEMGKRFKKKIDMKGTYYEGLHIIDKMQEVDLSIPSFWKT